MQHNGMECDRVVTFEVPLRYDGDEVLDDRLLDARIEARTIIELIDRRTRDYAAQHGVGYAETFDRVLAAGPELKELYSQT